MYRPEYDVTTIEMNGTKITIETKKEQEKQFIQMPFMQQASLPDKEVYQEPSYTLPTYRLPNPEYYPRTMDNEYPLYSQVREEWARQVRPSHYYVEPSETFDHESRERTVYDFRFGNKTATIEKKQIKQSSDAGSPLFVMIKWFGYVDVILVVILAITKIFS